MPHILVCDDDEQVLTSIRRVLESEGYDVTAVTSGHVALEKIAERKPDLVVLDIIMPEMNGIEVCRRIRGDPFAAKLPILFLTAKNRPRDVAEGLDAGADDFITKPFEVLELPARIRALLRRAPGGKLDTDAEFLIVGDLKLSTTLHEVYVAGEKVELTSIEHRLLHYLMIYTGQPIATEQLLRDVWDYPPGTGNPKLVHVHISNLRNKIEPGAEMNKYIRNVRGRGYLVG